MPIDVSLSFEGRGAKRAWAFVANLPGLRASVEGMGKLSAWSRIDVTAYTLVKDIYGTSYEIGDEDAAILLRFAEPAALAPGDVASDEDIRTESLLGEIRPGFLEWIAHIARATKVSARVGYSHERGDFLYESARWVFDKSGQWLDLACYDGGEEIIWQGSASRVEPTNP